MKHVRAVAPYRHKGGINFKTQAYEAWVKEARGSANANENLFITKSHYPWRCFHGLAYRYELPTLWKSKTEARLRFVEPVSLSFDTFPDYARYEIIPFIWDCWPCYFEKVCAWFKKHNVRTAIFTSSQTAERMRERFPEMNIMYCPEGIDTSCYSEGKPLVERDIDLLEFGRSSNLKLNENPSAKTEFRYVCTKKDGKYLYSNEQLIEVMGDAKVTIALPRSITEPEKAGGIETLTQRYWENMLSRVVMVGHAPQELVDLVGYNPVIEMDLEHPKEQILGIVAHIGDYQELADRNRKVALEMGNWEQRMNDVKNYLQSVNYKI